MRPLCMPVQAKRGKPEPTRIRLYLQILRILALQILFLQIFALANFHSYVSCTSRMLDKFTLPRGFSLSILCRTSQARLCDVFIMLRDIYAVCGSLASCYNKATTQLYD